MQRLHDIELIEVSLVDNPADPNARVAFFKRDDMGKEVDEAVGDELPPRKRKKRVLKPKKAMYKRSRYFSPQSREAMAGKGHAMPDGSFPIPDPDAVSRAVQSIGRADPNKRAAVRNHIIRRARALGCMDKVPSDWLSKEEGSMANQLEDNTFLHSLADALGFEVDPEASLDELDSALREVVDFDKLSKVIGEGGEESYPPRDTDTDTGGEMPEIDITNLPDEVVEHINSLAKERDEALAKAEELEKGITAEGDGEEDVLKSADPALREYIRKAEERAEAAEAIAKAEREARLEREFLAKAEQMPYVGESRSEFGTLLKSLNQSLPTETFEKVEQILKAANEQIREGRLFAEAGVGGEGMAGDAYQELEGIAKGYRKADPDLSEAEAFDKAMSERPDLYKRYLTEKGA